MPNSQDKGKRFERKIARLLNKKFDTNVRRTPQSGGMSFKGDIIDIDPDSILFDFHWELKNQERLNIWKALRQAENDKRMGKTEVVVFTKNHADDFAALKFSDLLRLLKEIDDLRGMRGEFEDLKSKTENISIN